MEKYVGAVVRKSFQLEIVAEIDVFEKISPLTNFVQYINEKLAFKKKKNYMVSWIYSEFQIRTILTKNKKIESNKSRQC